MWKIQRRHNCEVIISNINARLAHLQAVKHYWFWHYWNKAIFYNCPTVRTPRNHMPVFRVFREIDAWTSLQTFFYFYFSLNKIQLCVYPFYQIGKLLDGICVYYHQSSVVPMWKAEKVLVEFYNGIPTHWNLVYDIISLRVIQSASEDGISSDVYKESTVHFLHCNYSDQFSHDCIFYNGNPHT